MPDMLTVIADMAPAVVMIAGVALLMLRLTHHRRHARTRAKRRRQDSAPVTKRTDARHS